MTREELEYKLNKEQQEFDYYEREITNLKGLRETLNEELYNQEMTQFKKYVDRIKENIEELKKELESFKTSEYNYVTPAESKEEIKENITIDAYKEEIAQNTSEIEHLNKELQSLEAAKKDMPQQEYNRELESINRHLERVQLKLTEDKEIVNAYNSMRNNIIQLRRLNDMEERNIDLQDERKKRQEEINESRRKLSTVLQEQLELELINNGILSSANKVQKPKVNLTSKDDEQVQKIQKPVTTPVQFYRQELTNEEEEPLQETETQEHGKNR